MDPAGSRTEVFALLKKNFEDHFEGNRAPFGIHLHGQWVMDNDHLEGLKDFLDWVGAKNAWFVTVSKLIEWMQFPVADANAGKIFTCPKAPLKGPEICDGLDNDENGEIDENLVLACSYPQGRFRTCAAACPAKYPTLKKAG